MNKKTLLSIKSFSSLLDFLIEELEWPIPDNLKDYEITFEYSLEEIGLSDKQSERMSATVKQLRPFAQKQPWAIFWVDFETKRMPVTVLRRILRHFVMKRRADNPNAPTWQMEDIMFIAGHGEEVERGVTVAYFKNLDGKEVLREFSWNNQEQNFDSYIKYLNILKWDDRFEDDPNTWKETWKQAFTGSTREAVRNSKQLAQAMASIAREIRDRVKEVYEIENEKGSLHQLYESFKEGLIHDMTVEQFADMYAQTMTYGLFTARTMDTDGEFEMHEVADLIPSTNPFLKQLFKECLDVGTDHNQINLDELGIGRLVDLLDGLNQSDGTDGMQRILEEFGRKTFGGSEDPVIHFYEEFLKEYDSLQRVDRGVYYTPDAVVDFMVRSVNDQLKTEFGLEMGLADTTSWGEMISSGRAAMPLNPKTNHKFRNDSKDWKEELSRRSFVQILDPATGTGTFIIRMITIIHDEVKAKHERDNIQILWESYWNDYVDKKLFSRLYGFELMMASYSVAHMRIGMHLKSLGYEFKKDQRLNVYLTNTLESPNEMGEVNLFYSSIGAESQKAKLVKANRFFTVVLGNPPYSKISGNMAPAMREKVQAYKFIDGQRIKEKGALQLEINLQDDYVKFIRFAQSLIHNSQSGIVGYISNNGYLRNPTLRGMRWSLLNTFQITNILDLHGEYSLKLKSSTGDKDENVFDIQQGVSIITLLKLPNSEESTHFSELIGLRNWKYESLYKSNINNLNSVKISTKSPFFSFIKEGLSAESDYLIWPKVTEIFPKNSAGIISGRDGLAIDMDSERLKNRIETFIVDEAEEEDIFEKNNFKYSKRFDIRKSQRILRNESILVADQIFKITHRPFDNRFVFYNKNIIWSMSRPISKHIFEHSNYVLLCTRQVTRSQFEHVFITKNMIEIKACSHDRNTQAFPLYLFQDGKKIENINPEIKAVFEKVCKASVPCILILDYCYAILHSPSYRLKFFSELKRDYPRIPPPKNKSQFFQLVKLGSELRETHLMEPNSVSQFVTKFPIAGNNNVTKGMTARNPGWVASKQDSTIGDVWINDEQYFSRVPKKAWEFYIGGYQPAQKWLKDRKKAGRTLSQEDIEHYQKIIVALMETERIMKEIDKIEIE